MISCSKAARARKRARGILLRALLLVLAVGGAADSSLAACGDPPVCQGVRVPVSPLNSIQFVTLEGLDAGVIPLIDRASIQITWGFEAFVEAENGTPLPQDEIELSLSSSLMVERDTGTAEGVLISSDRLDREFPFMLSPFDGRLDCLGSSSIALQLQEETTTSIPIELDDLPLYFALGSLRLKLVQDLSFDLDGLSEFCLSVNSLTSSMSAVELCLELGAPDCIARAGDLDCNGNGVLDRCDVYENIGTDCNGNGWLDECEGDCDNDGLWDPCEADLNGNGYPDDCEVIDFDCNGNGIPDPLDISSGSSTDFNGNGVPDECEWSSAAYCWGNVNSAGLRARLEVVQENTVLDFVVSGVPSGSFGIIFTGTEDVFQPIESGLLCAGGQVTRLVTATIPSISNTASVKIGLDDFPNLSRAAHAGEPLRLQYWYRDPGGGGSTSRPSSNLSNARRLGVFFP